MELTSDYIEEKLILTDANLCYRYAKKVIEGRWKKGEHIIKTSPGNLKKYLTFLYANDIEIDAELMGGNPHLALHYCQKIAKKRCEFLEPIIAESARCSYDYAVSIIKGRFPLGEDSISQFGSYGLLYAKKILKDRFPEGERAIAKSAKYSNKYAQEVLRDRFPEGETTLLKDPFERRSYLSFLTRMKGE